MITADDRMAGHLTTPFARGADRLDLRYAGPGTASRAEIAAYDFAEHRATFGTDPKPRYVLRALRALPEAVTVKVHYQALGLVSVDLAIPAGTLPGASFVVPLGDAAPKAVLRAIEMSPAADAVSEYWQVTALLGDLAALLWAVGGEKDTLAAHLTSVRGQRALVRATGRSLDLIGSDLRVRRFPPVPYSFDPGTVALYHLDDPAGATTVKDAMALYAAISHPGTATGVQFGVSGRFATGARFSGQAEVRVAHHNDFAVSESDSLTVECFVKPDKDSGEGSALLRKEAANRIGPGWELSAGSFGRGIARNIRFSVTDGVTKVVLFADVNLDVSRFQHVAGVLDRTAGQARLYIDGVLVASQPVTRLGALTNDQPMFIGRLNGTVSEARISRAARTLFHPVLGEGDDSYRRRLTIFRRWTLPTPANLRTALNEVAGEVAGVANPFVVHDVHAPAVTGSRTLTVRPAKLRPGETMDALGRRDSTEAEASGAPEDDTSFDAALLADGADPRLVFTSASSDARRMRLGTRQALQALLDLIDTEAQQGKLIVAGFDPAAGGLRAVGRALVLRHETVAADRLAALAHRAGFSWVRVQDFDVYVSVSSTQNLELVPIGAATVGQQMELRLEPVPPAGAEHRWSIVHHQHGRAMLLTNATEPACRFLLNKPGLLTVTVDVRRGSQVTTATKTIRAGVTSLPPGTTIAANGQLGVTDSVAGSRDDVPFRPSFLVPIRASTIAVAPGANRALPELHDRFKHLADLVLQAGLAGKFRLISAWQQGATGLAGVGRALVFETNEKAAPIDRLGALAHTAGFDYVKVGERTVEVAHGAGELARTVGPLTPADDEITEGDEVFFRAEPRTRPIRATLAGTALCVLCRDTAMVSIPDTSGRVRRAVPTDVDPTGIAASPDGSTVYVVSESDSLTSINVATGAVTGTITLPANTKARAIVHHPTAAQVVVLGTRTAVVVNTNPLSIVRTVQLPNNATALAMAVDPDGSRVWITTADSTLLTVRLDTFVVSNPVTLPGGAVDIAVGPAKVYLVLLAAGRFCVVDKANPSSVVTHTDAGAVPAAVAVDPVRQVVYVADLAGHQVFFRTLAGVPDRQGRSIPLPGEVLDLIAAPNRLYFTTATNPAPPFDGVDAAGIYDLSADEPTPVFWPLGSGFGERLTWTAQAAAGAKVTVSATSSQVTRMTAERAGPVLLTARYPMPGEEPFSFRIGLNPELEAKGDSVVITKQQYDLVMNMLSELHPLGVEIDTSVLRQHVVELRAGLADAFPLYTYPTYRGRQPAFINPEDR